MSAGRGCLRPLWPVRDGSLVWQDSLSSDGLSMRTTMTGSLDVELADSRVVHYGHTHCEAMMIPLYTQKEKFCLGQN